MLLYTIHSMLWHRASLTLQLLVSACCVLPGVPRAWSTHPCCCIQSLVCYGIGRLLPCSCLCLPAVCCQASKGPGAPTHADDRQGRCNINMHCGSIRHSQGVHWCAQVTGVHTVQPQTATCIWLCTVHQEEGELAAVAAGTGLPGRTAAAGAHAALSTAAHAYNTRVCILNLN
jgi:hypothetical protein